MKKILFIAISLIVFILSINIGTAQTNVCPEGYTQVNVQISIPLDENTNCLYNVIFCVKCGWGPSQSSFIQEVIVHAIYPVSDTCQVNSDTVMNAIMSNINDPNWVAANLANHCSGNGWPPCDGINNFITIDYYYPICWKYDYFVLNEDPFEYIQMKVAGCNCFCTWSKSFCWNGSALIDIPELTTPPHQDPESTCECLGTNPPIECWYEAGPCE